MKKQWIKRFLDLGDVIRSWSKDKSNKTFAIIVDNNNRIVSTGYNGFPTGVNDSADERYERPQKYLYTEHAERNAIYNAARLGHETQGCAMVMRWFPCADCARAIIQAGIITLICEEPDYDTPKWGEHFAAAYDMLDESGVTIYFI